MAGSLQGHKREAGEEASSFLASLDHALESRAVSWLQAVESLTGNQNTESPGHGDSESTEGTNIHNNSTQQSEHNTGDCDGNNTAGDSRSLGSEKDCVAPGEPAADDSEDDVSVDQVTRTEAISLIRERTATRSSHTPSPALTQSPSTPEPASSTNPPCVVEAVDVTTPAELSPSPATKDQSSKQPQSSSVHSSPGGDQASEKLSCAPVPSSNPEDQSPAQPQSSPTPSSSENRSAGNKSSEKLSSVPVASLNPKDQSPEQPKSSLIPTSTESKPAEAQPSEQHSSVPILLSHPEDQSSQQAQGPTLPTPAEDKPAEDKPSARPSTSPHPLSPPKCQSPEQPESLAATSPAKDKPAENHLAQSSSQSEPPSTPKNQSSEQPQISPIPAPVEGKPAEDKPAEDQASAQPSSPPQPPSTAEDQSPSEPEKPAAPKMNPAQASKKSKKKKKGKKKNQRKRASAAAAEAKATTESANLSTSGQSKTPDTKPAPAKSETTHVSTKKGGESSSSSSGHEGKALPSASSSTTTAKVSTASNSNNSKPDSKVAGAKSAADAEAADRQAKLLAIQAAIDRLNTQDISHFDPFRGRGPFGTSQPSSNSSLSYARALAGGTVKVSELSGIPSGASESAKAEAATEKGPTQTSDEKPSGCPPSHAEPSTPQSAISSRSKLSPIQEATAEAHQPDTKPATDAEGDAHNLTPKSTSTTSTAWTISQTPQTAVTSEPSTTKTTDTRPKHSSGSTTGARLPPSSSSSHAQVTSSHAHPSPPPSTSSSSSVTTTTTSRAQPAASTSTTPSQYQQQISNARGGRLSTQKPGGFFWQLDSHGFPCAKRGCSKRCNSWDGVTVICPGCGPFSEIRYCRREHLLQDIKAHWPTCGEHVFVHPCRESTIPRDVREGPPMIPCLHNYDMPERHRQAVHLAMNARQGDYFIFSDWADYVRAGFPENMTAIRCSNRIVYTVRFDDAEEKDRFRRVLAICLFATLEVHGLVDYMYRLIRDKLRAANTSNLKQLEAALRYQVHAETSVTIQQHITGERHACETDWDGRNRRNCPDAVCRAEYRRLLGSLGGGGLKETVRNLESTYWILRAARTTHPTVHDPQKRMLGEGFEGVADEDKRVYRRGDGWDGAGTGFMEIEGINEGPEEA